MMRKRAASSSSESSQASTEDWKPSSGSRISAEPWTPPFRTAIKCLLIVRGVSALLMPFIADCDEVFNYWEPMHYLQYGYGQQTWEYSPDYAIRSWTYIAIHAFVAEIIRRFVYPIFAVLSFLDISEKTFVFYGMRMVLAALCAWLETIYYRAIVEHISPRIGRYTLLFMLISPGMFYAAPSFLPSTTSMLTTMLVFTTLIKSYTIINAHPLPMASSTVWWPIFWLAAGSIYAWPFGGAIGFPLVFEEIFVRSFLLAHKAKEASVMFFKTVVRRCISVLLASLSVTLILAPPLLFVEYLFYRKLSIVPWNIIAYNVFNKGGGGPELYGTSPWWFYIANGLLNFNIVFPLALCSIPIVWISHKVSYQHIVSATNVTFLACSSGKPHQSMLFKLLPVYLWLAIFTLKSHKEERFLFVIYPLICFNAAVSLAFIREYLKKRFSKAKSTRISRKPSFFTRSLLLTFVLLSLSRILSVYADYHASIDIYHELQRTPVDDGSSLCLAGEWYRFPSHYLLKDEMRINWKRSGFDGQLPKYFEESNKKLEPHPIQSWNISIPNWISAFLHSRPGTYWEVTGFNQLNKPEKSRYKNENRCQYLIEYFAYQDPIQMRGWKPVKCIPFLDRSTSAIHRAFFIPTGRSEKAKWGQYCLLERT